MRRAAMRIIVLAVVATCLACPIFQMFDRWDHGEAKGKDTETTLVIVALSVGLAIPVANQAFERLAMTEQSSSVAGFSLYETYARFANPPVPVSQPPPVLRI